jgi:MFS family permease
MTATEEAPSGPAPPSISVWAPEHRRLTTGLVLTITLVAFESLAISTVMPDVRDDLGQLDLYGWVFSAFFLGTLVGAVMAGRAADRRGTAAPFVLGLTLFAVGITIGGAAPSMLVLVLARVLQGLGAGAIPAVAYTSVGRAYPSSVQPRVFAVFSTAWVIPGMAGPAAASAISHALDWRFVFWAIVPLIAVALVMTLPALRQADARAAAPTAPDADGDRVRWAVVLAVGAGLVLAATTATSAPVAIGLAVVGVPVAARAFLALVPEGTTRLRPGLPAAIAIRGMVTFAFFGTDSFVPLGLTDARGQSTFVAGLALTVAVLGWTTAAWVQQHRMHRDGPRRLVTVGQAIGAVGILGAALLLHDPVPVPLGIAVWGLAGFGVGLSYAPLSVTMLNTAEPGSEGRASSSLQLCDTLGVALGTGFTGALVGFGESTGWPVSRSLTIAFGCCAAMAVVASFSARRLPVRLVDRG